MDAVAKILVRKREIEELERRLGQIDDHLEKMENERH